MEYLMVIDATIDAQVQKQLTTQKNVYLFYQETVKPEMMAESMDQIIQIKLVNKPKAKDTKE